VGVVVVHFGMPLTTVWCKLVFDFSLVPMNCFYYTGDALPRFGGQRFKIGLDADGAPKAWQGLRDPNPALDFLLEQIALIHEQDQRHLGQLRREADRFPVDE
jgi:hypothetical protein